MDSSIETESPNTSAEIDYEVERIDGKRILVNGAIQYFIKWKNYPDEDNTWEPVGNLSCEELIQEYEAKHADNDLTPKPKQIIRKRNIAGTMEYLVKWSDQSQSWMTDTDGTLYDLISEFEKKQQKRKRPTQPRVNKRKLTPKKNGNNLKSPIGLYQSTMTNFVFNGEKVDCIIDMKRIRGKVMYLVTYEDSTAEEWVQMDTVKNTVPHKVIEFYEACITWE